MNLILVCLFLGVSICYKWRIKQVLNDVLEGLQDLVVSNFMHDLRKRTIGVQILAEYGT